MYKRHDYLRFHTGNSDDDTSTSSSSSLPVLDDEDSDSSLIKRGKIPSVSLQKQEPSTIIEGEAGGSQRNIDVQSRKTKVSKRVSINERWSSQ